MTTQITATVIDGMLKPDQTLQLADRTRVHVTIEPIAPKLDPVAAWESSKPACASGRSKAYTT